MNETLLLLLVRLKVLKLNHRRIEKWRQSQEIPLLIYAATEGAYDIRLAAVSALGTINTTETSQALRNALTDVVRVVALAAAEALHRQEQTEVVEAEIAATLTYWKERDAAYEDANKRRNRSRQPRLVFDKKKLRRFNQFKEQVIAQMHKGKFYG